MLRQYVGEVKFSAKASQADKQVVYLRYSFAHVSDSLADISEIIS